MAQIVDVFVCVDRLHETTHATLRKVLQRGTVLALPRVNGAAAHRIDLAVLLARLPLHVMACLLAQQPQPAAQGASHLHHTDLALYLSNINYTSVVPKRARQPHVTPAWPGPTRTCASLSHADPHVWLPGRPLA